MQFTPGCVAALSRRLLGRNLPRALSSQPSNAPGFYGMPLGLPRARAWPVRPRPVFGGAWPFALRLKAICRAAVGISWSCSITFVEGDCAAPQWGTSQRLAVIPWSKPHKVAAPAPPLRGRLNARLACSPMKRSRKITLCEMRAYGVRGLPALKPPARSSRASRGRFDAPVQSSLLLVRSARMLPWPYCDSARRSY